MTKVVLRIIVAGRHELPLVETSVAEALDLVDEILVVEHNFTHTGKPKDFNFEGLFQTDAFVSNRTKVMYAKVDVAGEVIRNAKSSKDMHANEWLMRSSFTRLTRLRPRDIVVAVDADEVIYRDSYSRILGNLAKRSIFPRAVRLPMHQFYYRMNYLWSDNNFSSAVAGHVSVLGRKRIQWRDYGTLLDEFVGCHFSWQLTIEEMLEKLGNYGHNADYAHLAQRHILELAVKQKTYPFEPDRPFTIEELTRDEAKSYFPQSLWERLDALSYLLPKGW
jgi:hypothetical protein